MWRDFTYQKKIFCLDAEATESQFTAVEIFESCRVTSVVFKKKKKKKVTNSTYLVDE